MVCNTFRRDGHCLSVSAECPNFGSGCSYEKTFNRVDLGMTKCLSNLCAMMGMYVCMCEGNVRANHLECVCLFVCFMRPPNPNMERHRKGRMSTHLHSEDSHRRTAFREKIWEVHCSGSDRVSSNPRLSDGVIQVIGSLHASDKP